MNNIVDFSYSKDLNQEENKDILAFARLIEDNAKLILKDEFEKIVVLRFYSEDILDLKDHPQNSDRINKIIGDVQGDVKSKCSICGIVSIGYPPYKYRHRDNATVGRSYECRYCANLSEETLTSICKKRDSQNWSKEDTIQEVRSILGINWLRFQLYQV